MKLTRREIVKGGTALLGLILMNKSLLARFESHDQTDIQVVNAGVGGDNTINLLARIDKDCLSYHPKLTVLMVGTNDMNSVKHVPLAKYEQNLISIVKQIKATGSRVLIMTILPLYEPYLLTRHPEKFYEPEGVQGRRKQVNEVIKNVASQQRLHFLDLGHRFEAIGKVGQHRDSLIQNEANSNKTDGIHPTANGYRFIALAVYDYIVQERLPQNNIVCFGDSITRGDGSIDRDSFPAFLQKLLA